MPYANLALVPYEKGAETLRLTFAGSSAFGSVGNDELSLTIA